MKDEIMMPKEMIEAAYNRNWEYLLERLRDPQYDDHQQLQSRLINGSNILHVVVQHGILNFNEQYDTHIFEDDDVTTISLMNKFMEEVEKKLPILLCQTDFKGCTPLHYFLTSPYPYFTIIDSLKGVLRRIKEQASCYPLPPCEAKDFNGDTLLHLALRYYLHYDMANFLIEEIVDAKSLQKTNNFNQTPLHVICRYSSDIYVSNAVGMTELLIEKDRSVVHMYDADGLTPLLRAIQSHYRLNVASKILDLCPETIKQVDSQFGRNLLHFLPDHQEPDKTLREIIQRREIQGLMKQGDREGNTPLHLAILQRRFRTAHLLILRHRHLLFADNNDGKSPDELLGDTTQDIPREFRELMKSYLYYQEDRLRFSKESMYGVQYSNMKDFMGTLGVVAALLATITFTAAFTVPGGYDQDKGFPLLAKEIAFKVFMVTDVIGMCSSVMALCCLIWFFTSNPTGDEGRRMGDLSMGFLRLSFYSTLIAFMTGVYVTAFPQVRWLAIFTCAICSLIILVMMRKHFVMNNLADAFYFINDGARIQDTLFEYVENVVEICQKCASWAASCLKCR